jgi:hydrogenase maturation factor
MVRKLPTGKVPADVLRKIVFPHCGVESIRVIQGPGIGVDSAALDMGDKALILKANPITGAESKIGWLAVHINANDVAACGANPRWFMVTILLPEGADTSLLETIMKEIHEACCSLGISVIGGHTESVPGLKRTIISGFMIGEIRKSDCLTHEDVEPGDAIILTKGAGLEGTGILASDLRDILQERVEKPVIDSAVGLLDKVSVVKEALTAYEAGGVKTMHTPTEGGLLNGLWELAEAAQVGIEIWLHKVPMAPETREICNALDVDPLKLLNSGGLLIVVDLERSGKVLSALEDVGVSAEVIGRITRLDQGRILVSNEGMVSVEPVEQDELYRILEKYGS